MTNKPRSLGELPPMPEPIGLERTELDALLERYEEVKHPMNAGLRPGVAWDCFHMFESLVLTRSATLRSSSD